MTRPRDLLFLAVLAAAVRGATAGEPAPAWEPAPSRLQTRWTGDVSPERAHPEYPRPTLVRDAWLSLNGLWDFAIAPRDGARPERFEGRILVPFPIEAPLSGVGRRVGPAECLWYRREIRIPEEWPAGRTILRFGAVDWEATVFIDGVETGVHRGGYDGFDLDITDAVADGASHELAVRVWDPTDAGSQPRGKQVRNPGGIWYTPSTGIWQTVWLEPVPLAWVRSLSIVPDLAGERVLVTVRVAGGEPGGSLRVRATVPSVSLPDRSERLDGIAASGRPGEEISIAVPRARAWSPAEPWLHDLEIRLERDDGEVGPPVDHVRSYFGLRDVRVGKDAAGVPRILLNGSFVFALGPLDQGFWPDGLYAAPTDDALRHDVELTKSFGFNMARKHVKVEPERWYWWCDRLGLLVWQDMPSGAGPAPWPLDGAEIPRTPESAAQFHRELEALVRARANHLPSIVAWIPFNEGWGQFDAAGAARLVKEIDPTRIVIAASGGNDVGAGDAHDIHVYPGPAAPPAGADRAAVLGEFGGLGMPVEGHMYSERSWSYRTLPTRESLTARYVALIGALRPLVESRLSAAVYTQTSDLEAEFNGLVTYDREVVKLDLDRARAANLALLEPIPAPAPGGRTAASIVAWWRPPETDDISGGGNVLTRPAAEEDGLATAGKTGPAGPIEGLPLGQWTIAATFRIEDTERFHGIVGKDGRPTEVALAPLQLKVRGDDRRIQIEAIDECGIAREVRSRGEAKPGVRYRVVAASDGRVLRLWVDSGDGPVLEGETRFEGGLIRSWGTWSVGRGWFDGRAADRARAAIDEVRIFAVALDPSEL